jgi:hypothetical protein
MDVNFFFVLFELWGVEEISRERGRERGGTSCILFVGCDDALP